MPSRRDMIRMTPEEVDAYLRSQRRIILVTNGAQGWPHAVPMNYGIDDEGRVLITAFRKSQKVLNLERDPRGTLLVESGAAYHELRSVMIEADCELVTQPDAVLPLMRQINAAQVLAQSISDSMTEQVRASLAKRVVMRFTPSRVVSWDHGKLGEAY